MYPSFSIRKAIAAETPEGLRNLCSSLAVPFDFSNQMPFSDFGGPSLAVLQYDASRR